MSKNQKETAVWILQVPKTLDDAVEETIQKDFHMTKSEFIREAVRKRLEEIGVKPLKGELK